MANQIARCHICVTKQFIECTPFFQTSINLQNLYYFLLPHGNATGIITQPYEIRYGVATLSLLIHKVSTVVLRTLKNLILRETFWNIRFPIKK